MFQIWPLPTVKAGVGSIQEIKKVLAELNAKKVLIVTDKGIIAAGLYDRLKAVLADADVESICIDEVKPDPSIQLVDDIATKARLEKVDAVIGIGGGSSIDSAKVAAALSKSVGSIRDYMGVGLLKSPGLPIIAIPTTAGTGSEVTYLSILSDLEHETKKAFGSHHIIPKYAILDPELTIGLPKGITAATGIDALCHAVESYTSKNANTYTDTLALKAVELIGSNLLTAYNDPKNTEARMNMLLGSYLAGISFANAGVTAVHAFAYPLGGMFHVPHGMANSLMLPTIIKYNASSKKGRFATIASKLTGKKDATWQMCIEEIERLSKDLNMPKNLREYGIPESAIQPMSISVMDQTRLLVNNPREITQKDAFEIYTEAFSRE